MKASAIAAALNARTTGEADAEVVRAVHPAEAGRPGDLAVAVTPGLIRLLGACKAEMALTTENVEIPEGRFRTLILVAPSRSNLADLTELLRHHPDADAGIHPTAIVAADAVIGPDASIGPFTVIRSGATIGARSVILSQATIAEGAAIGEDCLIYPGVRIGWGCRLGDRVIVHHNASIGADGFGFVPAAPGAVEAARGVGASAAAGGRNPLRKIHALSAVEIADDVEIGALTAIDRGTLKPTRIGVGTKVDDLVMIGHNVEIGADCMLCGQVALAGSVQVGDGVVLGGRAAVADHCRIGAGAVVGAGSGVATNIPAGGVYVGTPAVPRHQALQDLKAMRRVTRLLERTADSEQGNGSG